MSYVKTHFSTIKKYIQPHKKMFVVALLFVLVENGIQLILPLLYGKSIDIVVGEKSFSLIVLVLIGGWYILSLVSEWAMRMRVRWGVRIGYKIGIDMFTRYVRHLIRLPLSFHRENKTGEYIERFDRADAYMDRVINDGVLQSAPHILTSFLAFCVIMWIRWELALIYLVFVGVFIIITIIKTKPIITYNEDISEKLEDIYGDVFERTPNVFVIKAHGTEEAEYLQNCEKYEKIYRQFDRYTGFLMKLQFWQHVVFSTGFLLLFLTGLYFITRDMITIGQFIMLLAYINMASASIQTLGSNYKELQEGLVTIARAEEIYRVPEEKYLDLHAEHMDRCDGKIEFDHVHFSYGEREILKDVNFTIQPGQMVAIVGKSGQGKTTLVDLIPRFLIPTEGAVRIDGIDVRNIRLEDLRRQIAIVSQENGLFHDSIKSNITYSRKSARPDEILRVARKAHCHEFVHKLPKNYDTLIGDRGAKLSAGQRQRLSIARAILRDPRILILDEATSALDSESEKYIQDAMEEVMRGRTTIVIAHRLSTVRKADMILVVDNGRIIERGDHNELIRHGGVYKKLHELQHTGV
ncbi:MAG: ABC transporter ATP-binding protein [Parcubacteria group bacterium]|jgi:subfamily B ATP-binding cassette protein MsbA